MRKVALIAPNGNDPSYGVSSPLNLGYIASYLEKNNIEVAIIDEIAGQNAEKELLKFSPDIVGITATTPLIYRAYQIADFCKKNGFLTVMGGVHVTVLPEEALKHCDLVVCGEGERAMLDIAKKGGGSKEKGHKIIQGTDITDIDEIPMPARHLMQMDFYLKSRDRFPDSYYSFVPLHTKVATIITGRGCPYRCLFCHNSIRSSFYRFNSAERVIREIEFLIDKYEIGALFSIEDTLFANKKRFKDICNLMKEKKIDLIWAGNARVNEVDLETLRLAKDVGCKQVTFGFESGSQRVLDALNKGTTVEQNKRAIELCRKVGIIPQGTFIVGTPGETAKDIEATKRFIKENKIGSTSGICIATPYPGTRLWEFCKKNNLMPQKIEWDKMIMNKVIIPTNPAMPVETIEKYYSEIAQLCSSETPMLASSFIEDFKRRPFGMVKEAITHPRKVLRIAHRISRGLTAKRIGY
jgi:radical SAM superfamily enzyme YgiQ (UPF0313 family)